MYSTHCPVGSDTKEGIDVDKDVFAFRFLMTVFLVTTRLTYDGVSLFFVYSATSSAYFLAFQNSHSNLFKGSSK